MGLGRLFNKRKRTLVTNNTTLISEQEVDSSPFSNLEERSTDLASAVSAEITEASSAQHDYWYNAGIRENDGDLVYSIKDDDDDDHEPRDDDGDDNDDERLSCISNVHASSELQNALMYYNDHGNAMASNHEDIMDFEEEQGVSMEVDTDNASQYCLSTSSGETGFLHSSGRATLQQEALKGVKRRTIDSEFEEYFASLLLK